MLSKVTYGYLTLITNMSWMGGGINFKFKWDKKLTVFTPIFSQSQFRRPYRVFQKILDVVYVIYVGLRLLNKVKEPKDPLAPQMVYLSELMQIIYVLTCYNVSVVLDCQVLINGDITPFFISEFIKYFKSIEKKYVEKSLVKCNNFLTVLFTVGNLIFLQNFLLMMKHPHRDHFFTSLLTDPSKTSFLGPKLPLVLLQIWVWWNLWTNIYYYIFIMYSYNCGALYLLRELNPLFKNHRTYDHLRSTKELVSNLNKLRVLHSLFNRIYYTCMPFQKSNTMSIAILAVYGVIKLEGRQSRIMGFAALFSLLYLASLYRKLGLVYEASVKLQEAWMHSKSSSKWMRKYIKGMVPFRVNVADYYFVRKTTVINVLYTILNGTITLLLT